MKQTYLIFGIVFIIAIIGIILVSGYIGEKNEKQPYSVKSDTSTAMSMGASVSNKYASLNEDVNISIDTKTLIWAPNTTIKIVLPEGLEYVSGELGWNGDLYNNMSGINGKTLHFSAKAEKAGKWQINASAYSNRKDEVVLNGIGSRVSIDICIGNTFEEAKKLCPETVIEPNNNKLEKLE